MAMRILHVVESVRPQAGCVAVSLDGLWEALQKRDVVGTVLADEVVGNSHPTTCTVVKSASGATRPAAELVRGVDVVHIHGWASRLARSSALEARRASKPYIISPMGALSGGPYRKKSWKEKLRSRLSDRRLIRRAAVITAINEQERLSLQELDITGNITVLPCGLSMGEYNKADCGDVLASLPPPPDGRCLLLLGPIHPIEGWVPLLTAFAELGTDADGWNVVLAGPVMGHWRKMLEAAVRRKGATDRVLVTTAEDVAVQRAWLARASVLAGVSLQARCPVSILQAVAAGVPVIASKWVAPPGLDGGVHPCTPNRGELKEAMRRVFRLSDQERTESGENARRIGLSVFDWPALIDRYVQLYNSLA